MIQGYFVTIGTIRRPCIQCSFEFPGHPDIRTTYVELLVDTGADVTLLSPIDAEDMGLRLATLDIGSSSAGVGGVISTRVVEARLNVQGYSTEKIAKRFPFTDDARITTKIPTRHSRESGNPLCWLWTPAFAGATEGGQWSFAIFSRHSFRCTFPTFIIRSGLFWDVTSCVISPCSWRNARGGSFCWTRMTWKASEFHPFPEELLLRLHRPKYKARPAKVDISLAGLNLEGLHRLA